MAKIIRLSEGLANLIAAGEVVERPRGVVKELIENSIDAHASRIVVSIYEGGLKKLIVEDNGVGMDFEDSLVAFERHATSKIQTSSDLFNITTMGFRGEALPSIASVAKVTLETSDSNDSSRTVIQYGKFIDHSVFACPVGTRIIVEDLFYETPARLKHMRSSSYEASLIQSLLFAFALGNPSIAFVLRHDDSEVFRTSGNGDIQEVVYKVFGKACAENCIPFTCSDFDYQVSGTLIQPYFHRSNRNGIYVFLNGRMVKDIQLYKAIELGYAGMLPQGRYPIAIIHVQMDPHILDVNVHPSKWEVRLSKANQLIALLQNEITHQLTFISTPKQIQPKTINPSYIQQVKLDFNQPKIAEKKPAYQPPAPVKPIVKAKEEAPQKLPQMTFIGIYKNVYGLAQTQRGLCVLDIQRIRKRITYEKLLRNQNEQAGTQELLVPVKVDVKSSDIGRIDELNEKTKILGIQYEVFGENCLIVRNIPLWLVGYAYEDIIIEVCEKVMHDEDFSTIKEKITKSLLKTIHFDSQTYTLIELQVIMKDLLNCHNQLTDPYGKPLMIQIDDTYLLRGL